MVFKKQLRLFKAELFLDFILKQVEQLRMLHLKEAMVEELCS